MRLVLDRSVRRGGEALIGGVPMRVLRLTPAGWRALHELQRGAGTSVLREQLARRLLNAGMAHPRRARGQTQADVTIVVPVRDHPEQLDRCLRALAAGRTVTVVDDGSVAQHRIAEVAARHQARLIRRPRAGGPAAARNTGLKQVSTELIAFVDSDAVPPPGWVAALAGHFEDPLVGAVAPRIRPLPGRGRALLGRYLRDRSPLDMGAKESAVQPGARVSYVPAAALLVRRGACPGGFHEELRYGEDVDLVWRLHDAGWCVRYEPSVVVAHQEPQTLARMLTRRFRYGSAAGPLAKRHRRRLAPAVLPPGPTLVALLVLGRRPALAALLAAQQSRSLARMAARLGLPCAWGIRLFGQATYQATLSIARYTATFALPLALAYGWRSRRPTALALLALPALEQWWRRAPDLDPLRWTVFALIDDAAYGAGVCWGAISARTLAPLIPALTPVAVRKAGSAGYPPSHPDELPSRPSSADYDGPTVRETVIPATAPPAARGVAVP